MARVEKIVVEIGPPGGALVIFQSRNIGLRDLKFGTQMPCWAEITLNFRRSVYLRKRLNRSV